MKLRDENSLDRPGRVGAALGPSVDPDAIGRWSERVARFLGTGRYLAIQTVIVLAWIVLNAIAFGNDWDPYPFILLNLIFSTQAAYAAPLILLAQNRQDARDRALATYKVPDVYFMPSDLEVRFLENAGNPLGPFHSKAVGEPPLMYGIGVFFALREAMQAFRRDADYGFDVPLTPERVLMGLHRDRLDELVAVPADAAEEGVAEVEEPALAK